MVKDIRDRIKAGIEETRKQLAERAAALGQKAEPLWNDVRGRAVGYYTEARTQLERLQTVEKLRGMVDRLRHKPAA